jgi:hypothetical protein
MWILNASMVVVVGIDAGGFGAILGDVILRIPDAIVLGLVTFVFSGWAEVTRYRAGAEAARRLNVTPIGWDGHADDHD